MDGDNETNTVDDALMSSEVFTPPDGCWVPDTQGYIAGSARELEQKLKLAGIKLRRELLLNAHNEGGSNDKTITRQHNTITRQDKNRQNRTK